MQETYVAKKSAKTTYKEEVLSKKFKVVCALIERLLGVALPIRRSAQNSYVDTPFLDKIALIEMPKIFFQSMRMYNRTNDPDNHVSQYEQMILIIAIHKICIQSLDHFSTTETWECILIKRHEIYWHQIGWYAQGIPRDSFMVWLALKKKLST